MALRAPSLFGWLSAPSPAKQESDAATLFVLVSMPRSGTHMLRTLLNQHPDIWIADEVFNEHAQTSRKVRKQPAQWVLDNVAWRPAPQKIRGFVAHLDQGQPWGIWRHLSKMDNVRYLCMRRYNMLDQYLSLQQALVHRRWQTYTNQAPPPVAEMSFKPSEVEKYFVDTQAHWDRFEEAFSGKPRWTVWYDKFCRENDSVSKQAQEFLGVDPLPGLHPETIKTGRPASELISNYEELRDYFTNSAYHWFFSEDGAGAQRRAA